MGTKLCEKHGELEHRKRDFGCLNIVKTIFDKRKIRQAKVVHHTHRIQSLLINYELSREVS